jgi:hypothetical protein
VVTARNLDAHRELCGVCKRRVIRCFDLKGRAILLESVDFGRGRMAITRDLVDLRLVATSTNQATSYRKHGCPTAVPAFSAASFQGKRARS